MMLSRVAESLYWIGRYLERAENVARLVIVATEFSAEVEGIEEQLAQDEWDTLLASVPGSEAVRLEYSPADSFALPYITALLLDEKNPGSVRYSLERARENARTVREVLTREVFLHLNTTCLSLQNVARRGLANPTGALESLNAAHSQILTTLGALAHTLSRDQGWMFLGLGTQVERALRTVVILQKKLPHLEISESGADLPLQYARWRSLLRSVASLENFRRARGARLEPRQVVEYLILDVEAPRAVRCSLRAIKLGLDALPDGSRTTSPDRTVGRLLAELEYDDERIQQSEDLLPFLEHLRAELRNANGAICRHYFET